MTTFVLVHGAWTDSSSCSLVADLLTAGGHTATRVELPGHGNNTADPSTVGLSDHTEAVLAANLDATRSGGADDQVVLVGHSMAGTVISSVAEERPEIASHLIYVAAFLLPSGQSLYGFTQQSEGMATSLLGPALRPSETTLGVDPEQARNVFLADADDATAAAALAGLRPDPLAPLGTPITVTQQRWGSVPRSYVHTELDQAVTPAAQTRNGGSGRRRSSVGHADRPLSNADATGRTQRPSHCTHQLISGDENGTGNRYSRQAQERPHRGLESGGLKTDRLADRVLVG